MYKVGDKVRIRTDLKARTCINGIMFNKDMSYLSGQVFTIKSIGMFFGITIYCLHEVPFTWIEEFFIHDPNNFIFLKMYV